MSDMTATIQSLPTDTVLSMYQASQYLQEVHDTFIRPQMMYTYGKKAYIVTVPDSDGKKVTIADLENWYTTFAARKANRAAVKAAQVVTELQGK